VFGAVATLEFTSLQGAPVKGGGNMKGYGRGRGTGEVEGGGAEGARG